MTLDEVIETLKRFPKDFVFERGFERPHSYRGYYDQLAFEPAENVRAALMLQLAERALGQTFEGYKGGSYVMDGGVDCHLAHYGSCGEPLTTYFFEANGQSDEIDSLRAQLAEATEIIRVLADIDSSSLVEPGSDDDRYTLYLSKPNQAHEIHGDDLRRARAFLNKD